MYMVSWDVTTTSTTKGEAKWALAKQFDKKRDSDSDRERERATNEKEMDKPKYEKTER